MTREDVLGVLIDYARLSDPLGEVLEPLEFETSVAAWRGSLELVGGKALGKELNKWFWVNIGEREWMRVLTPAKKRTLGEICDLIAAYGIKREIEAVTVMGCRCRKAGAFLAVREILAKAGADVSELHPTSRIEDYSRLFHADVFNQLVRLAPGQLPTVQREGGILGAYAISIFVCGVLCYAAILLGDSAVANRLLITTLALLLLTLIWGSIHQPRMRLGWVRTFRDLSRVLVGEWPREGPGFEVVGRSAV
jgi:hypothetical protein